MTPKIFFKNRALLLLYPYGALTSCKILEKTNKRSPDAIYREVFLPINKCIGGPLDLTKEAYQAWNEKNYRNDN